MGVISRLYDFVAGSKIRSGQVDEELNQLVTGHNDHDGRILIVEDSITNVQATKQYVNTQVTEAMLGNPPLGGVVMAMLGPDVQAKFTSIENNAKAYTDAFEINYIPSNNVILSSPAELNYGSAPYNYKEIQIPKAGKYRIKFDYRANSAGTTQLEVRFGAAARPTYYTSVQTSSLTYVSYSMDTPFLPANSIIQVALLSNSPTPWLKNFALCGDPVVGTTNTFANTAG